MGIVANRWPTTHPGIPPTMPGSRGGKTGGVASARATSPEAVGQPPGAPVRPRPHSSERCQPLRVAPLTGSERLAVGVSDVGADVRENGADLRAEEDQGSDGNDGDESKDQGVLSQSLPLLLVESGRQPSQEVGHGRNYLLPLRIRVVEWTVR